MANQYAAKDPRKQHKKPGIPHQQQWAAVKKKYRKGADDKWHSKE